MRIIIRSDITTEKSFINTDGETVNYKLYAVQFDKEAPCFLSLNAVKKRLGSAGELCGLDEL
jgi:hypothetical protein